MGRDLPVAVVLVMDAAKATDRARAAVVAGPSGGLLRMLIEAGIAVDVFKMDTRGFFKVCGTVEEAGAEVFALIATPASDPCAADAFVVSASAAVALGVVDNAPIPTLTPQWTPPTASTTVLPPKATRAALSSNRFSLFLSSSANVTALAASSPINPGWTPETALMDDGICVDPGAIPAYSMRRLAGSMSVGSFNVTLVVVAAVVVLPVQEGTFDEATGDDAIVAPTAVVAPLGDDKPKILPCNRVVSEEPAVPKGFPY